MVKVVLALIMSLGSLIGFSQETTNETYNVEITLNNIKNDNGQIVYALYDSEANMMGYIGSKYTVSKIENGSAKSVFENLKKGSYAVVCFHDENGNNQFDFDENGMPLESYGSSNNVKNPYGPPSFTDSKFEVSDTNLTFEIKL